MINEVAPPTAKHERMVKHIKKSYKKDGKLSDDEKSIAYATAWKNYNKEEVVNEIAMKTDKKVPLGRKSNPYGKRAVLKMIIKSMAERERSRAGVTKETTELHNELIRKAKEKYDAAKKKKFTDFTSQANASRKKIKFYDKKGSAYILKGKKKYD